MEWFKAFHSKHKLLRDIIVISRLLSNFLHAAPFVWALLLATTSFFSRLLSYFTLLCTRPLLFCYFPSFFLVSFRRLQRGRHWVYVEPQLFRVPVRLLLFVRFRRKLFLWKWIWKHNKKFKGGVGGPRLPSGLHTNVAQDGTAMADELLMSRTLDLRKHQLKHK